MIDLFDAGDPVAENNARREELRRAREDAETLKHLMGHRNGRAWLHRFFERCHVYGTPFVPGDTESTFFRLGEENIGKWILSVAIQASPDLYMQMLAEAKKEDERIAIVHNEEEKKRGSDEDIAMTMQGFNLPAPPGWNS